MKNLIISLLVLMSFQTLAADPFWSCKEGNTKYEIDWDEVVLNTTDTIYVKINDKVFPGKPIGMTDWSPDVAFYDYTRNKNVILLLDRLSNNGLYEMYEFENSEMGKMITDKVKCQFNY